MAQENNQFQENILINTKQVGTEQVERVLSKLLQTIEALPEAAKAGQGPVRQLIELLKNVKVDNLGTKEGLAQIKGIQAAMGSLKTLASATKLFENSDLQAAREQLQLLKQIEAQYARVNRERNLESGTYGSRTNNVRDAQKQLQELQRYATTTAPAKQSAGLMTEGGMFKIEQNMKLLQSRIQALQMASIQDAAQRENAAFDKSRERAQKAAAERLQTLNQSGQREVELTRRTIDQKREYELYDAQNKGRILQQVEERQQELRRRAIQQNRDMQQRDQAARLDLLNQAGQRQVELTRRTIDQRRDYELYDAQNKGRLLQQVEERQQELRRRTIQQSRDMQERDQSARLDLLNQTGQRQLQYRQIQSAQSQQYQLFNANPNKILGDAFRSFDMAPQGLNRLYSVNRDADPKVQAQQQTILDIQKQLVARQKEGNLLDDEKKRLLNAMLDAKKKEKDVTKETGDEAAKQAATERMLARVRGDSGAALATVQAALMANYAIINGVVGAFKSAVTTAIEYEAALKNVQAVTATSATDMADLDKQIRSVAAGSRFSSIEVANAALTLGQAGLSAKQIGDTLQSVTVLANSSGSNLAQAVDLLTSVIGVFDKHGSDAVDVVNKITQATNDSKLTVDRLGLAFQYVGNTAAQAGVSFEETTAALAAMSNAGIRSGSTMGTGLRQFLVEVQKPSVDFVQAINAIGLSMDDLDFKSHGFLGVVKKLREAGFQASDAIRSFDVRGAAAFNSMLANPEAMELEHQRLLQTTAAMEANQTQMESLKAQSSRLGSSLGNLVIEGLDPTLKILAGIASKAADATQALSELGPVIAIVGTALAGAIGVKAAMFTADLVQNFIKMSGTADAVGSAITALSGRLTQAGTAAAATTTAMTGLQVSSTAATLGIAGLVAAVIGVVAYTGFTMWAESAAKKIDELKASFDRATGAAQEKQEAIRSLSGKIEELSAREDKLTSDSQLLKNEVDDANTRFAKWGFTMDAGSTKLQDLVREVKNLRDELRRLSQDDLNLSVTKARQLAEARVDDAKSFYKYSFKHFGNIDPSSDTPYNNVQDLATSPTRLKQMKAAGVTDMQIQMLQDFAKKMASTDDVTKLNEAARVSTMLGGLDAKKMDPGLAELVAKTTKAVYDLGVKVQAANVAKGTVKQQEVTLDMQTRLDEAGKGIKVKGQNLEDFLSGMTASNPVTKAREIVGNKDPLALQDKVKDVVLNNVNALKEAGDLIDKSNAKSDIKEELKAKVQAEIRRQNTVIRENAQYAMESLKVTTAVESARDAAALKRVQNNMTLGLTNHEDYATGRDIIIRQQANKLREAGITYGKDNPLYQKMSIENDTEKEERLADFDRRYRESLKAVAQNALKQEEASLKMAEQKAIAQAKAERTSVSAYNTPDEIVDHMNKGRSALVSARDNELNAFHARVDRERIKADRNVTPEMENSWANQEQSITDKWAAQFQTFTQSFMDVYGQSTKRMYDLTRRIEARKAQMEIEERAAEDRIFAGDEQLRRNRVGIARATGPVSSRGVSETEGFLLQRANEAEQLASYQRSRSEKDQLMGKYQDEAIKAGTDHDESLRRAASAKQLQDQFLNGREPGSLVGEDKVHYDGLAKATDIASDSAKKAADEYYKAAGKVKTLRGEIQQLDEQIAGQTPIIPTLLQGSDLLEVANMSWKRFMVSIEDANPKKTMIDGLAQSLMGITNALGTAFYNIVTRTKSVKDAFRDMATGIIQSMLQILSQALAMQAMKSLFQALGIGNWMSGSALGAGAVNGGVNASAGTGLGVVLAATGGYFNSQGQIERVRKMANAGPITGGVPGRDSVPVLAMPGEFMVNKRAVDMVGTDFLHSLNAGVTASAAAMPSASARAPQQKAAGGDTNVWVVLPGQQPSGMGPKDVLVVVADDILRGGQTKKLIKSVARGEA